MWVASNWHRMKKNPHYSSNNCLPSLLCNKVIGWISCLLLTKHNTWMSAIGGDLVDRHFAWQYGDGCLLLHSFELSAVTQQREREEIILMASISQQTASLENAAIFKKIAKAFFYADSKQNWISLLGMFSSKIVLFVNLHLLEKTVCFSISLDWFRLAFVLLLNNLLKLLQHCLQEEFNKTFM